MIRSTTAICGVLLLSACGGPTEVEPADPAHLTVQRHDPTLSVEAGLFALHVDTFPDPDPEAPDDVGPTALLYVPAGYDPSRSYPLLVLLHGAGGHAGNWTAAYDYADELGIVLVIPGSASVTWDAIHGDFGRDIETLNLALDQTFDRVRIDPDHIALAGFSDGGSYALSVGTANGNLFSHVVGWSPGFLIEADPRGVPPIFVSHGTDDGTIPVAASRDLIVPALRARGLEVIYREFDGGHWIPFAIFEETLDWLLG